MRSSIRQIARTGMAAARSFHRAAAAPRPAVATLVARPTATAIPRVWEARSSRTFASGAGTDALKHIISEELAYEESEYEAPDDLTKPPKGWSITKDADGDSEVELTSTYGSETVIVKVLASRPVDEEEDFEEDEESSEDGDDLEEPEGPIFEFSVEIKKDGKVLTVMCQDVYGNLRIDSADLSPEDGYPKDFLAYEGPNFEALDPELLEGMVHYLQERGIDAELRAYLGAVSEDKEQRLYMRWLGELKEFL
mmetsp:Transcript_16396/g.51539  ORF Transcript_16396/g.51539 Transcript_16396/m.51539 type:complete len:252 (+) Transcript_16396:1765-2520(+)